jgi:carbonic anhydrase/acetyltransferase-like protein (isoleucine patch superfamily)
MIAKLGGAAPALSGEAFVAPTAVVVGAVRLAAGTSVWYGSVLRADGGGRIVIGALSNIQDNCTLHADEEHPVVVGERVTVGHNAVLHGCTVEDDAVIGIGAIVLDGARVGRGALIAAGSVVPPGREIAAGQLARGTPARSVGPVGQELRAALAGISGAYRELGDAHRHIHGSPQEEADTWPA